MLPKNIVKTPRKSQIFCLDPEKQAKKRLARRNQIRRPQFRDKWNKKRLEEKAEIARQERIAAGMDPKNWREQVTIEIS